MFATSASLVLTLHWLITVVASQDCVDPDDPCTCNIMTTVNDTEQPGHVIRHFNVSDSSMRLSGCTDVYLHVADLVLNTTLRDPCFQESQIQCDVQCNGPDFTITVTITRVDLHPPAFKYQRYNATVQEDVGRGTLVIQFSDEAHAASDPDCGSATSLNYALVEDAGGIFNISGRRGDVRVQAPLDYRVNSTYTRNVSVTADGKEAYTVLDVYVQDVDNQPPAFIDSFCTLNLLEEAIDPSWLTTAPPLMCRDQDTGINASVNYSFSDGANVTEYFAINGSSGQLRQLNAIDRENRSEVSLEIKCFQVDNPLLRTASAAVAVTILDVNDNLPTFAPAAYPVQVMENHVGVLALVTATDADQGKNKNFTYILLSSADGVVIDAVTGVVTSSQPGRLDRESFDNFTVVVAAVDDFGNRSSNNATIYITLLDQNDNSPVFQQQAGYNFRFNESVIGTFIGQILATDGDETGSPNSNITYVLEAALGGEGPAGALPVEVDGGTGALTVSRALEPQHPYTMLATACDNPELANDRRCSTVQVTAVLTLNSTFTSDTLHMRVQEDAEPGTIIAAVPIRGDIYNTSLTQFSVDPDSDMVVVAGELDREENAEYTFTISVTSRVYGVIGNVTVTAEVLDVNDNPPLFTADVYYFLSPNDSQASRSVGQLNSTDADVGANGNVTYTIHEHIFYELFTLDPVTGVMNVTDEWWAFPQAMYRSTAVVTDGGTPNLSSMATVYIISAEVGDDYIRMSAPSSKAYIDTYLKQIELDMAAALQYGHVTITNVETAQSEIPAIRTYLTFGAGTENGTSIVGDVLLRDVAEKWSTLQDIFLKHASYQTPANRSGKFGAAQMALIAVAGTVLLGGAVAIIVVCRQWNAHILRHQLFDHMTRRSKIYDSQELQMSFADDDDDADSRASSMRRLTRPRPRGPPSEGSLGMDFINTAFRTDRDAGARPGSPQSEVTSTPRTPRWTTFDSIQDVMASLEDLTTRLNAEDTMSGVLNVSRSRKSSAGGVPLAPPSSPQTEPGTGTTTGYILPPADYPGCSNGHLPSGSADELFLAEGMFVNSEKLYEVVHGDGQTCRQQEEGSSRLDRLTEASTAF